MDIIQMFVGITIAVINVLVHTVATSPAIQKLKSASDQETTTNGSVLSDSSSSVTPTVTDTPTSAPTKEPTPIPEEVERAPKTSFALDGLIYPNSQITGQTEQTLQLTSSNDANEVTDWYRDQIKRLGGKNMSNVITNSNSVIVNKIGAQLGDYAVYVTVKRSPAESETSISVVQDDNPNSISVSIDN